MKSKQPFNLKYEDMPVGMMITHVARTHMEQIRRSLESYGVQRTYGPILKELSLSEGLTQKDLAESMCITAPSMSVNLQKMENAGLLIRKADESDMRQIRLYLTEKGKETAEKADREIALSETKLIEMLSLDEQQELKRLLIKILKNQTKEGDKI